MAACRETTLEHELPSIDALVGVTLALMTGYSQALQAAVHPAQRVVLGAKIGRHLALLVEHPRVSAGLADVLATLQRHWNAIVDCTDAAALECQGDAAAPDGATRLHAAHADVPSAPYRLAAPARLQ